MSADGSPGPPKEQRPPEEQRPRLNPFVFPSDTTFRFALLVTAVLGANLYVWNWIFFAVRDPTDQLDQLRGCLALSPFAVGARDLESFSAASEAFSACLDAAYRENVWWMLGGTAGLLLVALALVALAPHWIERRRRLEPLSEEDAPAVLARLRELVVEAGLEEHEPRFLWNPLDPAPTGLAYGHLGRYSVALTGGLVTRQIADPAAFDAVVRHELAHIRNRDVDTTYTTLAIWYAFLVAAVVPFVFTLLDESLATIGRLSWRLLALALLVYLTRNAVLRSREVYADVRASVADGRSGGLRRLLAGLPKPAEGWAGATPAPAPRSGCAPPRAGRHASALPLRPARRVRLGRRGDDRLRERRHPGRVARSRPDRHALRGRARLRALRGRDRRLRDLARDLRRRLRTGGRGFPRSASASRSRRASCSVRSSRSRRPSATEDDALLCEPRQGRGPALGLALVVGLVLLTGWLATGAAYWLRSLGNRTPRLASAVSLLAAAGVLSVFMAVFYIARDTREVFEVSAEAIGAPARRGRGDRVGRSGLALAGAHGSRLPRRRPPAVHPARARPRVGVAAGRRLLAPALGGGRRRRECGLGVPRARRGAAAAAARAAGRASARDRAPRRARLLGAFCSSCASRCTTGSRRRRGRRTPSSSRSTSGCSCSRSSPRSLRARSPRSSRGTRPGSWTRSPPASSPERSRRSASSAARPSEAASIRWRSTPRPAAGS